MSTPSNTLYSLENIDVDLKTLTGAFDKETILLLGYYAPNDGGGGEFYWDAMSTLPDDYGSVIQPTGVTAGRWIRVFANRIVNVRFFGAVGDSTTDDINAINHATAFCITNKYILKFDNATYYLSQTFSILGTMSSPVSINIQFDGTTLKTDFPPLTASPVIAITNANGFSLDGQVTLLAHTSDQSQTEADGLVINNCNNFYIDTVITNSARFGVQLGTCSDAVLDNIEGYNNQGYQGGMASNGGSVFTCFACKNLRIKQIVGVNCWKAAIYFSHTSNDFNNENIQIDSADIQLAAGSIVANGVAIRSCINLQVGNLRVDGGISAIYTELNTNNHIVRDIHFNSVIATRCNVNTSVTNAIRIASISPAPPVENFKIDKISIDDGYQPSIFILNAKNVFIGSASMTNIPSNGIYIQDSDQVHFDYINITRCSNHGILIGGTVSKLYINDYYFEDIGLNHNGINVPNGSLKSCYINSIIGKYTSSQHLYCFYYAVPNSTDQLQIGSIINISGSGGAAFYKATLFAVKDSFFCRNAAPTNPSGLWNVGDFVLSTNSGPTSEYGFRCVDSTIPPGIWVKVGRALKSGVSPQSGTGMAIMFTIAHGLGTTPTYVRVQDGSVATANIQFVSVNSLNVIVNYAAPPPSGSNLIFYWEARV